MIIKSRTILVVDDDVALLNWIEYILVNYCFLNVVKSNQGKDTIKLFKEHQPDLILIDLIMPNTDGVESIIGITDIAIVPIIAMSVMPAYLKIIENLVNKCLIKPLSKTVLVNTVNSVLRNKEMNLIIIEDDLFTLSVLREEVTNMGFINVNSFTNFKNAKPLIDNKINPPNIIIMDLCMPDTDGFEFLQYLSSSQIQAGIIIVSGQSPAVLNSARVMGKFHNLNILGIFEKPVLPKDLYSVIRTHKQT